MKLKINKTFIKTPRHKKIKIQKIRTKLKNIIFSKLEFNCKIKNK